MKKKLAAAIALVLFLAPVLSGCGEKNKQFKPGATVKVTCKRTPIKKFAGDEFPEHFASSAESGEKFKIVSEGGNWKQRTLFDVYFLVEDATGKEQGLIEKRCLEVVH